MRLYDEKELDIKIEMVKDLICKKIQGGFEIKDIQEINESLNKLTENSKRSTNFLKLSQAANS